MSLALGPNGNEGGSYQFSGQVNSYIEFPNVNGGLDVQQSNTILCWVYPESLDGPIVQYHSNIVWGVHLWLVQPGVLFIYYIKRDYTFIKNFKTDQQLDQNKWHYVGSSYDHITGSASLWLNGTRVVERNIGAGMTLATQDIVRMGARADDVRYFKGRITSFQVYDVALTAEQVNQVKEIGLGRNLCHCLSFYVEVIR